MLIIDARADVTAVDDNGMSAYMRAALHVTAKGRRVCAAVLLRAGAETRDELMRGTAYHVEPPHLLLFRDCLETHKYLSPQKNGCRKLCTCCLRLCGLRSQARGVLASPCPAWCRRSHHTRLATSHVMKT